MIRKGSSWDSLKTKDGLASNKVYALAYDQRKNVLWCATHGGVSRIAEDQKQTFNKLTSDLPNDIVYSLFLEHASKAGKIDTSSILWFGTFTGLARYHGEAFPPQTFIVSSIKDTIGIGDPTFTVFARDNISHPDAISFRYRVIEIQNDGVKIETLPWRTFSFERNIRPSPALDKNGRYEIEVQARDSDGNVDPTPASRRFVLDIKEPVVLISSPSSGKHLAGEVPIIGIVEDRDFLKYEVDYRKDGLSEWLNGGITYSQANTIEIKGPVPALLATWSTPRSCTAAIYNLRVRAWDRLNHVTTVERQVVIDQLANEKDIDIEGRDRLIAAACEQKRLELYIPPKAFSEVRKIRITALDPAEFALATPSAFIGYKISVVDEHAQETYPALAKEKEVTMIIKDPAIVNDHDDKKPLTIFHQTPGNNRSWAPLGGTVDFERQTIAVRFSQFGFFLVDKDLRPITPKPDSVITALICRPRVFSLTGLDLHHYTEILFKLGDKMVVTIRIYNSTGRLVRKMENSLWPGENAIPWDGRNDRGDPCLSGLYLIVAQAGGKKQIQTVAIVNR